MSGTAWLGAGDARPAVVLPDSAVVESAGTYLAFVKVGPEAFEARTLKVGARSDAVWEILDGVRAGERVVTDGTYALRSLAGR
jgi:multidrug efflux pump subunit AcrA (membrane-fusion protein)